MILKYNLIVMLILLANACQSQTEQKKSNHKTTKMNYKVQKSASDWQSQLSPAQFNVLREKGTERPNTGEYNLHFESGTYACAGCGTVLFKSNNKYESHCGWPSFDDAILGTVAYKKDNTRGMIRTEIVCANCGGHLGHIFDDGPKETTGKRYCVNSLSLEFKKE